jgi:hypothetical protein
MSTVGSVGVGLAAPVLAPILVGAATMAVTGAVAVGTAYVAYHGVILAAKGAAAGTKVAIATGDALAEATQQAIAREHERALGAYQHRFDEQARRRSEAIAAMAQPASRLRQQTPPVRATSQTQKPKPVVAAGTEAQGAACLQALLDEVDHFLRTPAAATGDRQPLVLPNVSHAGDDGDDGTGLLLAAAAFCREHAASRHVAAVREALTQALEESSDDPYPLLAEVLAQSEASIKAAYEAIAPLAAEVEAHYAMLEQGASAAETVPEGWMDIQRRMVALRQSLLVDPEASQALWEAMRDELRGLLQQGQAMVAAAQQNGIATSLRRGLEAEGYTVISDGAVGTQRRIAATHLSQKRRVIFNVDERGKLHFDVMEGFHGEACAEVLGKIFAHMEAEGIIFDGPPTFDTIDAVLKKVGEAFIQRHFKFATRDSAAKEAPVRQAAKPAAEAQRQGPSRR